jgi:plasmid stabilization system protein ParE
VSGQKYRLTDLADSDIEEILTYTDREFGLRQFEVYRGLIEEACQLIGDTRQRDPRECDRYIG